MAIVALGWRSISEAAAVHRYDGKQTWWEKKGFFKHFWAGSAPTCFCFHVTKKSQKSKVRPWAAFVFFFSIVGHETVSILSSSLIIIIILTTLSDPSLSSSLSGTKSLQRRQRVLRLANEEITLGRKRRCPPQTHESTLRRPPTADPRPQRRPSVAEQTRLIVLPWSRPLTERQCFRHLPCDCRSASVSFQNFCRCESGGFVKVTRCWC